MTFDKLKTGRKKDPQGETFIGITRRERRLNSRPSGHCQLTVLHPDRVAVCPGVSTAGRSAVELPRDMLVNTTYF